MKRVLLLQLMLLVSLCAHASKQSLIIGGRLLDSKDTPFVGKLKVGKNLCSASIIRFKGQQSPGFSIGKMRPQADQFFVKTAAHCVTDLESKQYMPFMIWDGFRKTARPSGWKKAELRLRPLDSIRFTHMSSGEVYRPERILVYKHWATQYANDIAILVFRFKGNDKLKDTYFTKALRMPNKLVCKAIKKKKSRNRGEWNIYSVSDWARDGALWANRLRSSQQKIYDHQYTEKEKAKALGQAYGSGIADEWYRRVVEPATEQMLDSENLVHFAGLLKQYQKDYVTGTEQVLLPLFPKRPPRLLKTLQTSAKLMALYLELNREFNLSSTKVAKYTIRNPRKALRVRSFRLIQPGRAILLRSERDAKSKRTIGALVEGDSGGPLTFTYKGQEFAVGVSAGGSLSQYSRSSKRGEIKRSINLFGSLCRNGLTDEGISSVEFYEPDSDGILKPSKSRRKRSVPARFKDSRKLHQS